MAAIDKLHLANYWDFNEFRIWCIEYRPNLLYNFYFPFMNYNEWIAQKEDCYNQYRIYEEIKNKEKWINTYKLTICSLSIKDDKYLLWHCPFSYIREYLEKQCGYKTRWYHKLFFKK